MEPSWRAGGTTETDAPVGQHTVEFRAIEGWKTPRSRTVVLNQGETITLEVIYFQEHTEGRDEWTIF
jgi:hypothetical protein